MKSAWFEVQNSVNATSMVYRNVDEIKKKWDDVKRNTKKRAVSVRRDRNPTCWGERSVEPLSSDEEAVVSLIGEEKIYGISEGLDCFQQQTAETTKKGAAWVRKDQSLRGVVESNIAPLTTTEEIVVSLIGEEKIYGFQDEIYAFQQQFQILASSVSGLPATYPYPTGNSYHVAVATSQPSLQSRLGSPVCVGAASLRRLATSVSPAVPSSFVDVPAATVGLAANQVMPLESSAILIPSHQLFLTTCR
ncbi:Hypothetical predicted protein [Mytilus galloprovincialis]|uniref:Myb/SANT-like DNA-binding domain-containing protein n=1 Tax=Mytilus galloprovincialis TaxID=29158 RepID=A0A8B6F3Q4_MYTGA|nr:Hypothetical predicted protein [Mytilus galloprovincialis]